MVHDSRILCYLLSANLAITIRIHIFIEIRRAHISVKFRMGILTFGKMVFILKWIPGLYIM